MNMEMAARSGADDGSSSSGNLNLQCGWCVDEGRMVQVFSLVVIVTSMAFIYLIL